MKTSGTRLATALAAILLAAASLHAQERTIMVAGTVHDDDGSPLKLATVRVLGRTSGAITDRQGRFSFQLPLPSGNAPIRLAARFVGYETAEIELIPEAGSDTLRAAFILPRLILKMKEAVVVGASGYGLGDDVAQVTLRSLDVVTTPGSAADIFRALQTFPGVASIQDGSGLFVRGGDVNETIVLLDQATVTHPYRYESPTGGMFGTIPPFLTSGTFFSSGGFPARYGNALSGVLAMESMNMPERSEIYGNIGLAAASLGFQAPIIPGTLGVRFSGNRSATELMFRVNGRREEFSVPPGGTDGDLSVIWQYSPSGQVKFFNHLTSNTLGVRVQQPSFEGNYHSEELNRLHNIQWSDILERWRLSASISSGAFEGSRKLGLLDITDRDRTYKARLDAEREIGDREEPWLRILAGGEYERSENIFTGQVPASPILFDTAAPAYTFNENSSTGRAGGYAEGEMKLMRRLIAGIGIRGDYMNRTGRVTADPRASVRYEISEELSLRFSWGIYHQTPSPLSFNPVNGNPELRSEQARHLIAGLEYRSDALHARLEAYDKKYDGLIIRDTAENLINSGRGEARGVDIFLKYGGFLETPVSGWISYSFLHARRTQARDIGTGILHDYAPPPFDITHSITLVGKVRITEGLSTGATFRYATGAPFTPITDALYDPELKLHIPVQGAAGSERLPPYSRLDMDISYFLPFGTGHRAIFYLACTNVLDRNNVLGYDYSADYSTRTPRATNFLRSFYFGATVTLAL